ncbi:hypothetical protein [Thalassospira lucentensis]|uniref:hypothetical protein n=1 Tax=Thalassospira lucentensis TaxID=168935 RepID=UPI0003B30DAB|nr:hypothetical protein [Thalassospira lucentensis]RCK27755.1 hypothetical protein TH1_10800 [Thalassospira lucentensis MCCC 1A00383 = DSM 14000]
MGQQSEVDHDIVDAITDALTKAGLQDTPYGKKLERRLINKLIGQFEESDLFDLIEDLPLSNKGRSE